MASFNTVILMGHLTRDPELRQAQSGNWVAKAGIAINERAPDGQGGYRDEAHFFDLTFFGRTAESFGKWFQKGSLVLVEGKLQQERWETKDGQKRSKVGVVGFRWHFCGEAASTSRPAAPAPAPAPAPGPKPADGGGLDFVPSDVPF